MRSDGADPLLTGGAGAGLNPGCWFLTEDGLFVVVDVLDPKRPPFFLGGAANSFVVQLAKSFLQPEAFFLQSPLN